jgi:hypothetical protein
MDISKKVNKLDLANELIMDGDKLDEFLKFLSDPEINLISIENGRITTDRVTESFTKVMEVREYEREKKQRQKGRRKKGKDKIPEGNGDFPDSFPGEIEEFPQENDTDKIRSYKTRRWRFFRTA